MECKTQSVSVYVRACFAMLILAVQVVLPITPALASERNETEGMSEEVGAAHEPPIALSEPSEIENDEISRADMQSAPTTVSVQTFDMSQISVDDEVADSDGVAEYSETERMDDTANEPLEGESVVIDESGEGGSDTLEVHTPDVDTSVVSDSESSTELGVDTPTPIDEEHTLTETAPDTKDPLPVEEDDAHTPDLDPASTTTITVVQPEVHTVQSDAQAYTFDINDCARVADGSFYCSERAAVGTAMNDRVYAAPDADGDSEIFIEKSGVTTQITFNAFDDAAPFYDERSDTIVFHRLVDARYQIVSYDLSTAEEEQLTFDSYNNMQPSRSGDLIVWQGWVGNDWEIILYEQGEIKMITDNTTHDIGPRINGDYIIWQAEDQEGWKVHLFNTVSESMESIDDANAASIENPRLVLVYDAKHQNGDIETRGYDLETKKNIALGAQAPVVPEDIPDPDQTGEERALIVNATQLKLKTEDDEHDDTHDDLVSTSTTEAVHTQEMSSAPDDLVIPSFGNTTVTAGTSTVDTSIHTSIDDLVVPAISQTVTEELAIPDLVVMPYTNGNAPSVDSQGGVAEVR